MIKTVWINNLKRMIKKTRYGMYQAILDDDDIKWLNKIHKGGK